MNLHYITTSTPVGDFHMICERQGERDIVCASGFGELEDLIRKFKKDLEKSELKEIKNHPYKNLVNAYFKGDKEALHKINYKQEGTAFQQKVWKNLSKIKPGKTASYKDLAKSSGNIDAVRAAGTACGRNKICLIVPCHRILTSDGKIGGYFYGTEIKKYLLGLEGVYDS